MIVYLRLDTYQSQKILIIQQLSSKKIISKINNSEGTVSKLVNQDSLHLRLTKVLNTADKLLLDFKANPKKYVSVSVFGNNKKAN